MNKIGFTAPSISEPKQISQGEETHIISRLDYLEIKLNAWWGTTTAIENTSLFYDADPANNAIIIKAFYLGGTPEEKIDEQIKRATIVLTDQLKSLGWDDWVIIKTDKTRV